MAKLIDAYDLIEELDKHLVEWDYTSQSGFELVDFVRGIINDHCQCCFCRDEWFRDMCDMSRPQESDYVYDED